MNSSLLSTSTLRPLTSQPVRAVLTLLALATLTQYAPQLSRWKLLRPNTPIPRDARTNAVTAKAVVGETTLTEESSGDPGASRTVALYNAGRAGFSASPDVEANAPDLVDGKPPPVHLEDSDNRGMDLFYAALNGTLRGQAGSITRIVHFGDSLIASDYVSGTLRRLFQKQFGDSGHGFSLIANAWPAYFHEGVARFATSGWLVSRVVGPYAQDGWYGLGGVSFRAPPNILARIGTAAKGNLGRSVSRFELAYVASQGGGTLRVRIDGKLVGELSTQSDEKAFRTAKWEVPDGSHELELLTTRGTSRLFGVVMERDTAGVVLDAIGIQGARLRFLDQQDDAHYASQLQWRNPHLVIYEFGANESADGLAYSLRDFHDTMKNVLLQQRVALPKSSCLVVGAMDRATRSGDSVASSSFIPMLVAEQRAVAQEVHCAFFDTYQAMGGAGAMPRWVRRGLGQADLTHPTAVGADIIGTWIYRAIMERWRQQGGH